MIDSRLLLSAVLTVTALVQIQPVQAQTDPMHLAVSRWQTKWA